MEAVKAAPKTATSVVFTEVGTRQSLGRTTPVIAPEVRRQERVAWIVIAAIWGIFAFSMYVIWMKANIAL
ncbi:MAG: hypothetical protein WDO73_24940 [Ignavibacteriota bacterium]